MEEEVRSTVDIEDVRREVEIMKHLVMELCEGDKAKIEGGTKDDGEDEDEYEDDDGNGDEDGDDEEKRGTDDEKQIEEKVVQSKKAVTTLCVGFDNFSDPHKASLHCLAFCFLIVATAMATAKIRRSSFFRNLSTAAPSLGPGLMCGPNGMVFLSSGIHDLDKVLGGGFLLGSLVMVMEDAEEPHHMLLLRNFMAQGLVHDQPLLYASPARDLRGFLGILPSPAVSKDDKSREPDPNQEKGLRIAWQYKKYFSENHLTFDGQRDGKREYSNEFDLRKPLERHLINGQHIDYVSIQGFSDLSTLQDRCATFLSQSPQNDGIIFVLVVSLSNHFVLYSVRIPTWIGICLTTIRSLKSMVQSLNSVAIITFPPSFLSPFLCKRWQHMADTLLSVKAIQDEDKKLALLLTGYQDMVGFLNVHKVARINTQVQNLLVYPPEHVIFGDYVYELWDEETIRKILDHVSMFQESKNNDDLI
ncbi:Elongator complex protein 4 [Hibiscus syriacus]|uniref:Elongator complex protein 4 n=1 Tax=Hibiscus syriacus TaxID=106335 RepID=A0A6A3CKC5_HIBSY|nr:Elongator complex protein 4 [Hibiscus syriacus]